MKIVAIGIGQCGCNVADDFYAINKYARSFFTRRIEILTDAFAINTAKADLEGFKYIPKDKRHRILIGEMRTLGHGVGKVNTEAAKIVKDNCSVITDQVLKSKKFYESDAVVVIASGGGGTGSGMIGWVVKELKQRMLTKPVYAVIVLPFGYEEKGEVSFALVNTAKCLKSVNQYADAVFLLDNERFAQRQEGLSENMKMINRAMVMNFYDLFCAGEEKVRKHIGVKVVDAGDIKQSLEGITTIGRGEINLSTFYRLHKESFREKTKEGLAIAGALDQAINNLCLTSDLEQARKILCLICAPRDIITLGAISEITTLLQERSPLAEIRQGDYPRRSKEISVTLVVSKLTESERMESLYDRAEELEKKKEVIDKESEEKIKEMHGHSQRIPDLY